MSKPSGNQTVTQTVDKDQQARNDAIWQRAQGVANQGYTPYTGQQVAGADPYSNQARNALGGLGTQYDNLANQGGVLQLHGQQMYDQGQTGMQALAGNQQAINTLWNPYQSKVLDEVASRYGDLNAAAQTGIQDQATKAGAFGGSRHGVASGVASGEIAKGLGSQMAQLQSQGYNDMMGRAAGLAGLGQNGLGMAQNALGFQAGMRGQQQGLYGQQFGMGDYYRNIQQQGLDRNRQDFNEQRDWDVRNFDILRAGGQLPYGQSTSQPLYRNTGAGVLGGAASGAGVGGMIGGPIGAGVGAGVGGILGIL